jgi:DNA polymerase
VERGYSSDWAAQLGGAMDWWAEAGVDCLVQDEPRAWLKAPDAPPVETPFVPSEVEGPGSEAANDVPRLRSRPAEEVKEPLPDQLPLFREWLRTSDTLPYATPAAPRICPSGDPAAGLMVLAGMPSSDDCTSGTLLSGKAGILFDRMLAAIGRRRETIYLAGLSCLRPASGRFDAPGAARCAQIALHHLGLVAPKAVLLIGDGSVRPLLGLGALQARGRVHRIETQAGTFDAVATLSPDYLLNQPASKAHAWADLQLLMETLK